MKRVYIGDRTVRDYVSICLTFLQREGSVVIEAMGSQIPKAIEVAVLLRESVLADLSAEISLKESGDRRVPCLRVEARR